MNPLDRWQAPTPEFFKKVIKISLTAAAAATALWGSETVVKAIIPDFQFTLLPWVKVICKNVIVAGVVAAAVAKFAKLDTPE